MIFLDPAIIAPHYSIEIPESGNPLQNGGILLTLRARA
jgi:hypothetical protein